MRLWQESSSPATGATGANTNGSRAIKSRTQRSARAARARIGISRVERSARLRIVDEGERSQLSIGRRYHSSARRTTCASAAVKRKERRVPFALGARKSSRFFNQTRARVHSSFTPSSLTNERPFSVIATRLCVCLTPSTHIPPPVSITATYPASTTRFRSIRLIGIQGIRAVGPPLYSSNKISNSNWENLS